MGKPKFDVVAWALNHGLEVMHLEGGKEVRILLPKTPYQYVEVRLSGNSWRRPLLGEHRQGDLIGLMKVLQGQDNVSEQVLASVDSARGDARAYGLALDTMNKMLKTVASRGRLARAVVRNAPPEEVKVTDHAVLRYLERVHHVDVQAVRNRIAKEAHVGVPGRHVVQNGKTLFLKRDDTVVTVLHADMEPTLGVTSGPVFVVGEVLPFEAEEEKTDG